MSIYIYYENEECHLHVHVHVRVHVHVLYAKLYALQLLHLASLVRVGRSGLDAVGLDAVGLDAVGVYIVIHVHSIILVDRCYLLSAKLYTL